MKDDKKKPEEDDKKKLEEDDKVELNENELDILKRMNDAKAAHDRAQKEDKWASIYVGQKVTVFGFEFKVAHISEGFLVLESSDACRENAREEGSVWSQLKATGAKTLLRIDGTPLYVETRILTSAKDPNVTE